MFVKHLFDFFKKSLKKFFCYLKLLCFVVEYFELNLAGGLEMAEKKSLELPRADFPEQVGVDSKEIKALIDDLEANNDEVHSIQIIRHGKVAYERWRAPYAPDIPHTMYSVSKSFTAIAMGFLIDEGYCSLDTKVIDLFPEYKPKEPDEKLEMMTVFHLLTMTAGKNVSVLSDKKKSDWVKQFFDAPWEFAPGEGWHYISENTYLCSVIIKKLTGLTMREYLKPRLFDPLGYNRMPFWECDRQGREAGGWGLFITTDELSKFIVCVANNGVYAGKQVIPAWYVEMATSNLVSNEKNENPNSRVGYGFFFWQCNCDNTYRADGMFSQFGIVFKDYDAQFIITQSEIFEEKSRQILFKHLPKMFIDDMASPPQDACSDLDLTPLPVLEAKPRSPYESTINGRLIHLDKNPLLNTIGWPVSMLTIPVTYMSAEKGGNIDNVVLRFAENTCSMTWNEGSDNNTIECGMDGRLRMSPIHLAGINFTAASSAAWEDETTLLIYMRPVESICERRLKISFNGQDVKIKPTSSPDIYTLIEFVKDFAGSMLKNDRVSGRVGRLINHLDKILEAPINGKMI